MNFRGLQASLLVLSAITAIAAMGCGSEIDESECRFVNPDVVAHIKGRMIDFPRFLWKVDDPAHIFLEEVSDYRDAPTWSINLRSGAVTEHEIPWVMNPKHKGLRFTPPGYLRFEMDLDEPLVWMKPLGREKTLRAESSVKARTRLGFSRFGPEWPPTKITWDGEWRVMFGTRPLLTRQLTNVETIPEAYDAVRIHGDGDLLVCMCVNHSGTWVATYRISELIRTGATSSTPLEKQ